jgi:hypothetical protein
MLVFQPSASRYYSKAAKALSFISEINQPMLLNNIQRLSVVSPTCYSYSMHFLIHFHLLYSARRKIGRLLFNIVSGQPLSERREGKQRGGDHLAVRWKWEWSDDVYSQTDSHDFPMEDVRTHYTGIKMSIVKNLINPPFLFFSKRKQLSVIDIM